MGDCESKQLAEVGSRPEGASRDGVLDLAGNVAEWVLNSRSGVTQLWAVCVGGRFWDPADKLGIHSRIESLPPSRTVGGDIGFRCASG